MKKVLNLIVLTLTYTITNSCKNETHENIIGYYELDKTVLKNKENVLPDFRFLKINENKTFELSIKKFDSTNSVKGNYDFISEKRKIIFFYNEKKLFGEFKGNIFYLNYPNDFHNGKYKSLLFVKTNNQKLQ